MRTIYELTRRDLRAYFKDKGTFFSSLMTPLILLLLYATFLANVFRESFVSALPEGFSVNENLINATCGGQLVASLLAVSCVTIAFCANLLMIGDKANESIKDLTVSPVRRSHIALSYFLATTLSTLIIAGVTTGVSFLYLAVKGWYLSVGDVFCLLADILLLTLFGTALSSCLHFFLSTNGQAAAVGTIVSAGYGFICGAYMPISTFSTGLQRVLSFLPGTYGTSLLKNHMMRGVFEEMATEGFPPEVIDGIRTSIDCKLTFFGKVVPVPAMYAILGGSVLFFTGLFVLFHVLRGRKRA